MTFLLINGSPEDQMEQLHELDRVAKAAVKLFGHGPRSRIKLLTDRERAHWDELANALQAAGYGWEEPT